jgi:N-acetylmuramoyl-L-alanine amidase
MAPTIYRRAGDVGIDTDGLGNFGPLGEVYAVTVHHSAGPRAPTKAKAQELHRAYHRQHREQGWGGIGYHWSMDDLGRFYRLRPIQFKGAHTAGFNTGNPGLMIHGNYDRDRLTNAQKESLKWLFRGGLVVLLGEREREIALVRGHREWPNNPTACPGADVMRSLVYRRNKDFH